MNRSERTAVATPPRGESYAVRRAARSASIHSVHDVVRISRRFEVDRMSRRQSTMDKSGHGLHGPRSYPGLATSDEWVLGDPRNGNSRWGKFRDWCGAFVNSAGFQHASTCVLSVLLLCPCSLPYSWVCLLVRLFIPLFRLFSLV